MEINNECIIFCEEHYNPLGVIRSLGEKGIRPVVIIQRKSGIPYASKSKYIKKLYKVNTIEEGFKLLVEKYGNLEEKPFVFTCDDKRTALLDENYDLLKDKFYFFNAGQKNRISEFIDKSNIYKLAEKYGLKVLKAVTVKKGEIPADLQYPIITKPVSSNLGAWKLDMFICHNEQELKDAYKKIQAPLIILQKYIVKKNEYCLDGYSINNGKDVFISIASTYNYYLPLTYSPLMTLFNFDKPDLKKRLNGMFSEIGFEGIFSIEFLIDQNNDLFFGEINFRNSTWSYASTCLGMNLPYLWIEGTLSKTLDCERIYRKIPENYTAMVELADYITRVKGGVISFKEWYRDFKSTNVLYIKGRYDNKPFLTLLIHLCVISKIKKLIKRIIPKSMLRRLKATC